MPLGSLSQLSPLTQAVWAGFNCEIYFWDANEHAPGSQAIWLKQRSTSEGWIQGSKLLGVQVQGFSLSRSLSLSLSLALFPSLPLSLSSLPSCLPLAPRRLVSGSELI